MSTFYNADPGSAVQPCPLAAARHWIEIQLLGEDDSPVPDIEYKIVLPNGDTVRGFLDGDGRGRVEAVGKPGDCQVTFPGMDTDAWTRIL